MIKILNTRVYGLEESIVSGAYPMELKCPTEEEFEDKVRALAFHIEEDEIYCGIEDDYTTGRIKTSKHLGNVPTGTGHDNFLKGVIVQHDIYYPNYWTPQFQRYSFHDIVSSNSKMHRLTKMDIESSVNKYVDKMVIENVQKWADLFNMFHGTENTVVFVPKDNKSFVLYSTDEESVGLIEIEKYDMYTKYEVFMKLVSNCPMGLEQFMRSTTNYLQLKTIYKQRCTHKLKEDWGSFCAWCESLPMFVELCLKGKRSFTDKNSLPLNEIYNWKK